MFFRSCIITLIAISLGACTPHIKSLGIESIDALSNNVTGPQAELEVTVDNGDTVTIVIAGSAVIDFGDGTAPVTATNESIQHTYTSTASFTITITEVTAITDLDVSNNHVVSASGLSNFTNLVNLDLSGNDINESGLNDILVDLDTTSMATGIIDVTQQTTYAIPSGAGATAASNLSGAGVTINATQSIVPNTPTNVSVVAGNGEAVISFDASVANAGPAVTGYTVTSAPGGLIVSSSSSPITVTGLTNGVSYTFTVVATNTIGNSTATAASSAVIPSDPFVSVWRTTGASESITLPLRSGYNYNFTVDWGDASPVSTVTTWNDADITQIYAVAGDHTVTISGLAEAWYFNNDGDKSKIIQVVNFGDLGWTYLEKAFYGCNQLTNFAGGVTSNVTMMNQMFRGAINLASIDLASFDTSSVTNMDSIFQGANSLITLDLSSFDTAGVTSMYGMFYSTTSLTTLDLSSFDTSNVINMSAMFYNARSLTTLDLSSFDTSNVTTMDTMFRDTVNLVSINLSSFDTSNVTNMREMFRDAASLTSLDLSSFDTSNVTNMREMFQGTASLTSLDLSGFNTSNVTNMNSMFTYTYGITSLDLTSFDTSNVTDMGYMFYGTTGLTSLNLSSFDTSSVITMANMFYNASALTSLDLSNFNTSSVTDMSYMFAEAYNLTALDLTSFNTSNVTNMLGMFGDASGLTSLDLSSFDTSKVETMDRMFAGTTNLTILDLSNFDTSSVTDMSYMFWRAAGLTALNTTDWDINAVVLSTGIFSAANAGIVVTCNQGGFPATGTFFGKSCN